jgi:hypothetical protein
VVEIHPTRCMSQRSICHQPLTIGVAERIGAQRETPPLYLSMNNPGGDAHNLELEMRYAGRISPRPLGSPSSPSLPNELATRWSGHRQCPKSSRVKHSACVPEGCPNIALAGWEAVCTDEMLDDLDLHAADVVHDQEIARVADHRDL